MCKHLAFSVGGAPVAIDKSILPLPIWGNTGDAGVQEQEESSRHRRAVDFREEQADPVAIHLEAPGCDVGGRGVYRSDE